MAHQETQYLKHYFLLSKLEICANSAAFWIEMTKKKKKKEMIFSHKLIAEIKGVLY